MRKIKRIFAYILVLFLALSSVDCLNVQAKEINLESSFWVEFVDVGQGDCAIIQCDGKYMMIDGGSSAASSIVYTILKDKGINNIDYMVATHPDADHIGGLSGALNYASVGTVYSPVKSYTTKTFKSLVKYVEKQGKSITIPKSGDSFELGSANIQLLGPVNLSSNANNNSIIVKVTYGTTSFLFMGDAETDEENDLINSKYDINCDVIKIGHHGSRYSSSSKLLNVAGPEYAIISVGKDNSYGHPTDTILSRLSDSGINVYRTDLQGDIICNSDGKKISFSTEKEIKVGTTTGKSSASNASSNAIIPSGTTYVLNTKTKRFHLTTCSSVNQMAEKNTKYSTESAAAIVAMGYQGCGNCKPYVEATTNNSGNNASNTEKTVSQQPVQNTENTVAKESPVINETPVVNSPVTSAYVLNTNTKKFHYPTCRSVKTIADKNRKDVTMARDEIVSQGYSSCGNCHP